ncbi:MAG: NADH-quinone oxidoreductase subunit A [Candidatus Omnitrophica bacterium]|nr:NADH-quinone oxidoreductase subunit A [Candidatus Omnitrophota bacterium]
MDKWLLSPPGAFIVMIVFVALLSYLFSKLSFHGKKRTEGSEESYACGEDDYDHMAQPNYSQFFPFAFFFTIAHVATLILTSVPVETLKIMVMALIYISAVIVGLVILLER